MPRVVVTGMGLVTSLGNSLSSSWSALLAGNSGVRSYLNDPVLKNENAYNLGLVSEFDFKAYRVPHASSRLTAFLASSTREAMNNSGLDWTSVDRQRVGVCLGSLASSMTKVLEHIQESAASDYKTVNRLSMLQVLNNIPAATICVGNQFEGPALTVSSACASGLSAIVEGAKWILLGQADIVLAGAAEDVYNPYYTNSSVRLQAMTTRQYDSPSMASCPFDRQRSGFVLGEGSGMLVLESLEHAQARGAHIFAELVGYGYTCDGHHLVRPEASGKGQVRAMKQALKMASAEPHQVDHLNAHATSTQAGDEIEARAIREVFGSHAQKLTVSAIKSSIGHTFAAAGSIETIFGLMSMRDSVAPQIVNLHEPEVLGINYARSNTSQRIDSFLKNSFGFGGINVSCLFRRL